MKKITLTQTSQVVGKAFEDARLKVSEAVRDIFPNAEEEVVTVMLHYHLHTIFNGSAFQKEVQNAFEEDIKEQFPHVSDENASALAEKIVANVFWHNRTEEGRSGGDLALLFSGPVVPDTVSSDSWRLDRRGLLLQAKRNRGKQWRSLTEPQERKLDINKEFLGILRYHFGKTEFNSFDVILCRDHNETAIKEWFTSRIFPTPESISDTFLGLAKGTHGTNDTYKIGKFIQSNNAQTIEVVINWRKSDPPDFDYLRAHHYPKLEEEEVVEKVRVYRTD